MGKVRKKGRRARQEKQKKETPASQTPSTFSFMGCSPSLAGESPDQEEFETMEEILDFVRNKGYIPLIESTTGPDEDGYQSLEIGLGCEHGHAEKSYHFSKMDEESKWEFTEVNFGMPCPRCIK